MKINEKQLRQIVESTIREHYLNEGVDEMGMTMPNIGSRMKNFARQTMSNLRNKTNNLGRGYSQQERGEGRVQSDDVNYDGYGNMYGLDGKNMDANSDAMDAYNKRMNGKQNPKLKGVPQDFEAGAQERLKLMQDIRAKIDGYLKAGFFGNNPDTLKIVQYMQGACDAGKSTASSYIARQWKNSQNQGQMNESPLDYFRKTNNGFGVKTTAVDTDRNMLARLLFPKSKGGGKWMKDLKKEIEYAISKGCWPKDSQYLKQVGDFLMILCNSYGLPVAPFIAAMLPATCTGGQPMAQGNGDFGQDVNYSMQRSRGQSNYDQNTIQQTVMALQSDPGAYVIVTPHSSSIKQNANYDNNALEDRNYQAVVNALTQAGISADRIQRGSDEYTGRDGFGGAEMENTNIKVVPGNSFSNPNMMQNMNRGTIAPWGSYTGSNVQNFNLNESKLNRIIRNNIRKAIRG